MADENSHRKGDDEAFMEEMRQKLKSAREHLSLGDLTSAISLLQQAAPALPEAAYVLADCLRRGIGVNGPQALRAWYILERLIKIEYVPGMVLAATWLRDYYFMTSVRDCSIPKDDVRSLKLLKRVLELEPKNPDALCAYGVALMHGRGTKANSTTALVNLHDAIDLGHTEAYYHIGVYYLDSVREIWNGKHPRALGGRAHEYAEQGLRYVEAAAEAGEPLAHLALAEVYRDMKFPASLLKLKPTKAERLSLADKHDLLAVEHGAPQGYVNIGEGFATGTGASGFDFDKAAFYFSRAFQCGVAAAADALGYHFEKGSDRNIAERINLQAAVAWYERGYNLEHAASTMHLGESYDDGIGVTPDAVRAEQLYIDAMTWAKRDGEKECLASVRNNLIKLYVGRSFLDGSQVEAKEKLVGLVGLKEAEARTKQVRTLLTALTNNKKAPSRRAKLATSDPLDEKARNELPELVGSGCAQSLISTFTL